MYKTKLQELCHQRVWNLPVYTTAKQGLDHNPRFQATVTVNDQSFTTPDLYKSSKEAQNDAARIAFQHFSSPPPPPSTPAASSSNGNFNIANSDYYYYYFLLGAFLICIYFACFQFKNCNLQVLVKIKEVLFALNNIPPILISF